MPQDKPPTHTAITVLVETKKAINRDIRNLPHMLDEDGLPISMPLAMDEVVNFYIKAHQKGRK